MSASTRSGERRRKAGTTAPRAANATANRTGVSPAWVALALATLTAAVFAPVRHFPFVSWDDPFYVTQNAAVARGLTLDGVRWALTAAEKFYWHPLTWLSHMADVEAFGLNAGPHHVVNVVLHIAGTLLLFDVLRRTTGYPGRSAAVAALFAVHPLHVESVAWVAERKDVLSGALWMLSLAAYAWYARTGSLARYVSLVVSFALGLMAKPTLVTLPLVLLLLDAWPLGRTARPPSSTGGDDSPATASIWRRLVLEKAPLFALSLAASFVTFFTQLHVGAVHTLDLLPLGARVSNAAVSAVSYLGMASWPSGLAAFYPFVPVATWRVAASLLVLAAISYAAFRARRRRPYLLVGWLWYLVTLLPVIGLVQVGSQGMADRFMYVPLAGLLIASVWGIGEQLGTRAVPRWGTTCLAAAVIVVLAIASSVQVQTWKDSETLWRRAVDEVPDNHLAHANLGLVLAEAGRTDESFEHFSRALAILQPSVEGTGARRSAAPPEYLALLHRQLGLARGREGRWPEAVAHFREAAAAAPRDADTRHALGQALAADGQLGAALDEAREAVRLEPSRAEFHGDLASVHYRAGDVPSAISELQTAIGLQPGDRSAVKWHYNLAAMLNESGRRRDALRELESVLAIDPSHEGARRALALLRGRQ